uniref:Uncharacterized protein n=1 Tax=Triticum urartu TaxID=4572 RepID=A0A8R7R5T9_TRIUA
MFDGHGLKLCRRVLNLRKHIVTLGGGHQYFTAWTLDANLEELIIDVIALQLECKVGFLVEADELQLRCLVTRDAMNILNTLLAKKIGSYEG